METTGEVPLQPWEGPEYNWVDRHNSDPLATGDKVAAAFAKKNEDLLLDNSDEIRDDLLANFHTPPPDVDIDKPEHFLRAFGVNSKPIIIFKDELSIEQFTDLLKERGIPWYNGGGAQYSHQIDANIVYPPQVPRGYSLDEVIAHEGTHTRGTLPGQVWSEGIACVIQELYARLCGTRDKVILSPPYSAHDIGLITVSNLCSHDPLLFESMLNIVRGDTAEAHRDFLTRMYDLMGSRRFWYINKTYGPRQLFDSLPSALRGTIPDKNFDRGQVLLDKLIPIARQKLTEYEALTGYSFGLKGAAHLGATALGSGGVTDQSEDATTKLIRQVTQTMIVDD
jgi:hypothetical protein